MKEMLQETMNAVDLRENLEARKRTLEIRMEIEAVQLKMCNMDMKLMRPVEAFEQALKEINSKVVRIFGVPFRDYELGVCKDSYK